MSVRGLALAAEQVLSGQTGDTTGGLLGVNHMLATGDVVKGLVNQQIETFQGLDDPLTITGADGQPRPPEGPFETGVAVVRRAQQAIGAVSGIIGAAENALDMAFGALTAPLAALYPSMPSATLGSLYIGCPHTHTHPPSLIPPAPPIPLPSIGAVLLGNSVQVLLGGMPAARAGDKGVAITCGGLSPFFDIKLGSSNVFIGGKRAARIGDMCDCCVPSSPMGAFAKAMAVAGTVAGGLGMLADAGEAAALATSNAALSAGKAMAAAAAAAQMAADAAAMAAVVFDPATSPAKGAIVVPGAPLVLIGGFPMMPTLEFAKALLNKLKALARRGRGPSEEAGVGTGR
jgi:uncharacterized Zn-binding protein involved in type VI secretion